MDCPFSLHASGVQESQQMNKLIFIPSTISLDKKRHNSRDKINTALLPTEFMETISQCSVYAHGQNEQLERHSVSRSGLLLHKMDNLNNSDSYNGETRHI